MSGATSAVQQAIAPGKLKTEAEANGCEPILRLRLARGPLVADQAESILTKYNQLTQSKIPMEEFRHWIQDGPEGPAWHALLETEDGQTAGHLCLIPFRSNWHGRKKIVAKAEYFFVEEQCRSMRVKGFEDSCKPAAILLLDQLYRHCQAQGWGPLLISATPAIQPLHRMVGCRSADFPLVECLFILRPWMAATRTPNLSARQRVATFLAGCAQFSFWAVVGRLRRSNPRIRRVPMSSSGGPGDGERLAMFEDEQSVRWRFPEKSYARLALEAAPDQFVISKRGSGAGYTRVCQWGVAGDYSTKSFLLALLREARAEKALGVRWAVYGDGEGAAQLTGQMKRIGFLCVRRTRRLLQYTKDKEFLRAGSWKITDSLFSFDP
jgi:hypothetical protein